MFQLLLTVNGPNLENGQSALLLVEEVSERRPEPALTPPLLTVELIVKDKALRLRIAILMNVQVMSP